MSDDIFFVKGLDNNKNTAGTLIAAKFLMINGVPVVNPIAGEGQKYGMYDRSGNPLPEAAPITGATNGQTQANPNNYIIVSASYDVGSAQILGAQVAAVYASQGSRAAGGGAIETKYEEKTIEHI